MPSVTPNIDQTLVLMLRRSLRIQDPQIETDPVYQYDDFDLWEVIQTTVPKFDSTYTISTLPQKYYPVILVASRIEVLWRLAMSTAPYYRLEAEGASLEKNMRFDHYMMLIKFAREEYADLLLTFGGTGKIEVYDLLNKNYHLTKYNYERSEKPSIELILSEITSNSVNLDWSKFETGVFACYKLYISTSMIIDPYSMDEILKEADLVIHDIHRTKYRFSDLLPDTLYYVAVITKDVNGNYGYSQKSFTTLPAS